MRLVLLCLLFGVFGQGASVTMGGYDLSRTNATTTETVLTQANVVTKKFGLLGSYSVDGAVYAQPLYIESVAGKNVLVVVTMHNSVYAFDTALPGSSPLWTANVGTPLSVAANTGFPGQEIGCLSTPVASAAAVLYADCVTSDGVHKLYSYNVSDGTTYHAPVTIAATASGVTFDSTMQKQRAGLLLNNGNVYLAFASYGDDIQPYYGWMIAYNASTLAQTAVWCSTCAGGGSGAGIWMSGGGPASDSAGNVYAVTGNGTWNGTTQYGESFVKLSSSLVLLDFFTPTNWATLNTGDQDLGSGRAVLVSDAYVIGISKGLLAGINGWVLDAANMGHLESGGVGPVQSWSPVSSTANRDGYAFANSSFFVAANTVNGTFPVQAFSWGGSSFTTSATATSVTEVAYGVGLSYSSNAAVAGTGIVWVTRSTSSSFSALVAGSLRALRSDTLAEIWAGPSYNYMAKFTPPIVVNGRVFVATSTTVDMYGLLPSARSQGVTLIRGAAIAR